MTSGRPIGGELELGVGAIAGLDFDRNAELGGCAVDSGRSATGLALRALETAGRLPDRFLLPAYLCQSMVQPFVEAGVPIGFYRVDEQLRIDLAGLERLAAGGNAGVLFANYFGFPISFEEREALVAIGRDAFLIEDCAHGSLVGVATPAVGSVGHVVLTSFRKYLPVPDGALLVNRTELELPPPAGDSSRFVEARLLGKLLRHEFLVGDGSVAELEAAYLALFSESEAALDRAVPDAPMSPVSRALLDTLDVAETVRRRRANYEALLEAFSSTELAAVAEPLFPTLPDSVSPLVFPVRALGGNRDLLRANLAARSVFCPVHWPLPDLVSASEFPEAHRLSAMMLGLPIDQRYDESDMEDLAARVLASAAAGG